MKTHASLFSGIGGFDLAAEWMGWANVFNCEIDDFCATVLKYHFSNAIHYGDIKKTDFTQWRGKINILSGGFPCQPFSMAGKRKGANDNRYLWPEMLRAIREIKPDWIIGENVAGILSMVEPVEELVMDSLDNVFGEIDSKRIYIRQQFTAERICSDIEREGYKVKPFVIPACAVGAPHRRDRIWFVADRNDAGVETSQSKWENRVLSVGFDTDTDCDRLQWGQDKQIAITERKGTPDDSKNGHYGTVANTNGIRQEHRNPQREAIRLEASNCVPDWKKFPTQSPVCARNDGFPIPMDRITFPKWRREAIKAYGNAIVPQVAYEIFKAIEKAESLYKKQ